MTFSKPVALAAGAGLLAYAAAGLAHVAEPLPGTPAGAMPAGQVYALARAIAARHLPLVDPRDVTAIAKVESGFDPRALGDGGRSYGLMQVQWPTARDLADRLGYGLYQLPAPDALYDPQTSIFYGAAYLDWLQTYGGEPRGRAWAIRGYNGGPGNAAGSSATARYLEKVDQARRELAPVFGTA